MSSFSTNPVFDSVFVAIISCFGRIVKWTGMELHKREKVVSYGKFFASLKKELINRKKNAIIDEVKTDVFRYIELFYNRKRLHSSPGV